jgi:Ca2+-binding EF-hand superfamily protein
VDPLDQFKGNNAGLSADELKKAKEVFLIYEPVQMSSLVTLLRAMGLTPSFLDMRELHKKTSGTELSFQQFLDIYAAEKKEWDSMDEVITQLASFDHNNDGTIDSNEMVSALTTLGDTMTEAQCQKLTVLADEKGRINIVVLAKHLLTY